MGTTITLEARTITIVITGDGVFSGCTYNKLDGWYGIDSVDLELVKRPNAPGAFAPLQTFPDAKAISIEGSFFGRTRAAALQMREDLAALYSDGEPVTMTVADDLRSTSREVLIETVGIPWTIHPEFEFTVDMKAADPRRYGVEAKISTGLAVAGSGFEWPIEWPVDWGAIPVNGRVTLTNSGNTATTATYTVSGGSMPDGFEVVNVTTGERLTYIGAVASGTTVTLDATTRTAFINGSGPGSRYLSNPQWWTIPARSSIAVQFLARGNVTGTPRLDVATAPAYY